MHVVLDAPCFDFAFRVLDRQELIGVQAFVAQLTVECFDKSVLRRLSRPNELQRHAAAISPLIERTGSELRAVIHRDGERFAVLRDRPIKRFSDRSPGALFWSGLKAGALTFGGAYTVIPFLQRDAVTQGAWMSNSQFLDGVALSGLLPAPLIIFSTFVGYLGGGPWGAIVMTIAIFLPAFAFTLVGHDALERLVHEPRVRPFLEGLTAGVVGLIAGTTVALLKISLVGIEAVVLFAASLVVLFLSKARLIIPAVIAAAALWGLASLVIRP